MIKMAKIEREYNIPLRREFQKAPRYKKAKKALSAVRIFLEKHMKSNALKIGKHLNEKIWSRGAKNPPHHVLVKVVKEEDGSVFAELRDLPVARKSKLVAKREKKEQKKEAAKKLLEKAKEKKEEPKEEKKTESPKEEKKEEPKKEEKAEEKKAEAPKKEDKKEEKPKR